jgi:hypothetical protein
MFPVAGTHSVRLWRHGKDVILFVLVLVLVLVLGAVVLLSISRTKTIGAPLILRHRDVSYEVSGVSNRIRPAVSESIMKWTFVHWCWSSKEL